MSQMDQAYADFQETASRLRFACFKALAALDAEDDHTRRTDEEANRISSGLLGFCRYVWCQWFGHTGPRPHWHDEVPLCGRCGMLRK